MHKKGARLEALKMIIGSREIGTQHQLVAELRSAGYPCTQATLSRDLAELRVSKAPNSDGEPVYVLPGTRIFRGVSDTHMTVRSMQARGIVGVRFSGNLAVVRTLPGHAQHVALDIDEAQIPFVLGTVAGDDTVMVVLEEGTDRPQALNALGGLIDE